MYPCGKIPSRSNCARCFPSLKSSPCFRPSYCLIAAVFARRTSKPAAYIIWPLLLGFLYRCGRSTFVIGTACRFAGSFALHVGLVHVNPESSFYLLPCRFWELLAGACLTYAQNLSGEFIPRNGQPDKHLAYAPASQLRRIVLMLSSTDATQEGGRHRTIRSD
jgi:hypothetical protein